MRLIACDSCHTQFDVTDVTAAQVTCRCGKQLANDVPEAVDAKVHRCGSCGASASGEQEICTYCGSQVLGEPGELSLICPECYGCCRDNAKFCTACGVAFRPEEVRVDGYELPCPVCEALMPAQQVGGLGLNECTKCHGLWVPGDAFDALVARATAARRDADTATRLAHKPRMTGSNPAQQRVKYRKCPDCQAFMQRRNYQKSSGVIVDVCATHGTWLDADELEQIAGFLTSGGKTSESLIAEKHASEQAYKRLRAERAIDNSRSYSTLHIDEESTAVGTLLDIFTTLIR